MLHRLQRQPQIGFAHQQRLDDFRGVLGGELARRIGEVLPPALQCLGDQRLGQRRRADQPQRPLFAPAKVAGEASESLQIGRQALAFLLQDSRFGGGLKLAAHATEQRETQLLFGMLENLARRRLRDMQQLGRRGQAAGLQDGLEEFDMTKAHGQFP